MEKKKGKKKKGEKNKLCRDRSSSSSIINQV